ncbi:MAG: hypothetical protein Q7S29_04655 [Candidatus Peribacter sp.]|nr:hypothetical protein [Candidatus Peribacter sp.]
MATRTQTLKWGGMPHTLELIEENGRTVFVRLTVIKPKGTQMPPTFALPDGITMDQVLDAWLQQKCNWEDLFTPVREGGLFAVVRSIDLGRYRILWYVLHIDDVPQDHCMVLRKSEPAPADA